MMEYLKIINNNMSATKNYINPEYRYIVYSPE